MRKTRDPDNQETPQHRKIELIRGMWGAMCLLLPDLVLERTGGDPTAGHSRLVIRILGARQLTQAVLSGVAPTSPVLAMGVWVDAVHAGTAVGLAAIDRRYAKPALADAVIAASWAGAGGHDLAGTGTSDSERRRSRFAIAVLRWVPCGSALLARAGSR